MVLSMRHGLKTNSELPIMMIAHKAGFLETLPIIQAQEIGHITH